MRIGCCPQADDLYTPALVKTMRTLVKYPEDELAAVKQICDRIGYGAVMNMASLLWREFEPSGAFSVGPCFGARCVCGHDTWSHDEESGHRCLMCRCGYFQEQP